MATTSAGIGAIGKRGKAKKITKKPSDKAKFKKVK
jgi:hypothetical protein